jgi:L-alanine-DL-glutamate epimerase-like enolase superfamily enzyme
MKVTRLRTRVAHLPVAKPFSTGRYDVRSIDCVCVFLETDAGLVGEGMCYVTNGRRLKVLREMVVSLEHLVVGLQLGQSGSFVVNAFNDVRAFGRQGSSALAISAVEKRRSGTCGASNSASMLRMSLAPVELPCPAT